jgi:undecaprenyl diphosphate synthase
LALSYSSRDEIARAARLVAEKVATGQINAEDVTDELIHQHLYTAQFPDPELMIRTSGECRISNFLLYQLAYAELYFTNVHWPDFRKPDLYEALTNYQNRERRFGKTSEQIQTNKPEHTQVNEQ